MMKHLLPMVMVLTSLAACADEVNPDDRMLAEGQMLPTAVSIALIVAGAAIVAHVARGRRRKMKTR